MRPKDANRIEDAQYFTGVEKLTEQIQSYHRSFIDHPDGSFADEYVANVGFEARDIIVKKLSGSKDNLSKTHLEYGVLTGLATVLFTKPYIQYGLESHLDKVEPPASSNISRLFLLRNMPGITETEIDSRFRDELTPAMVALASIYNFDGECDQTTRARESIERGFIAGANTVISMCDDWQTWINTVQIRFKAEQESLL